MQRKYLLGINHHLIFPDSMSDPEIHEQTLPDVLSWPEFDVVDLFCSGDDDQMMREAEYIRASGKTVVYNSPLLYQIEGCDPNSTDPETVTATREVAQRHLDAAEACGADKINIASGQMPTADNLEDAWDGWIAFLTWFGKEAEEHDLRVVIEPFDSSIGKNLLIGPTADAVRSVEEVRNLGVESVGLMVDMGHLPIMNESFSHALAFSRPYLWHIHLGSAVIKDPTHPMYGDCHPPIELPGGEHDVHDLARFLAELDHVGYFAEPDVTMTIEMQPYPGKTPRESALKAVELVKEAWSYIP